MNGVYRTRGDKNDVCDSRSLPPSFAQSRFALRFRASVPLLWPPLLAFSALPKQREDSVGAAV